VGLNIYKTWYCNYLRIAQWYGYSDSNLIWDWSISTQWHSRYWTGQVTYTKLLVSFLDGILIQYDNRILLTFTTEFGIRFEIILLTILSCHKDTFVSLKVTESLASCYYFHLTAYVYYKILKFSVNCPLILAFIFKLYE
jgi:hypothetical protein